MGRDTKQRTDDVLATGTQTGSEAFAAPAGARLGAPLATHVHRDAALPRLPPAALGAAVTARGKLRLAGKIRSPVA